ncbi:MAG: HAD-IB family phosphatase [Selenomonadaceae bacterium]|nr:HAD-IB family phosphatase [Selenomonadaceae bacterium]
MLKNSKPTKYCFDLDSTITKVETLPFLAEHFGVKREMEDLSHSLKEKNLDYAEDLKLRLNILKPFPIKEIQEIFTTIPLCDGILRFIRNHAEECAVVTSNVDLYINRLMKEVIGCEHYASTGVKANGRLQTIKSVISKESVVISLQRQGYKVAFTGDGINDAEAVKAADLGVAASYVKKAAKETVSAADIEAATEAQAISAISAVGF